MRKTTQYLNDEHMQLYQWCGAGAGTICDIPAPSKRSTSRLTACGVLALMGSLLILSGCNTQNPAEQANGQAAEETRMKAGSLYEEDTSKPASVQSPEAAGYAGETPAEQPAPADKPAQ